MKDSFGREIDYLRISITDRCNLRCRYCMPDGVSLTTMEELLTLEEIAFIVRAAAELGIRHIKLTGGEPLIRRNAAELIRMLKAVPGIECVTMTTNGILLEKHLPDLLAAGLDAVNISLDTVDRGSFERITGTDAAETVLSAVSAAYDSGIRTKINAVSLDLGEEELWSLLALARDRRIDIRFIEMMPIGLGKQFPVISHEELKERLKRRYPEMREDTGVHGFGPAVYYRLPGYSGSIGLISAIHGKFCSSCNRVRLTSTGYLKSCLCYNKGADLREIIRAERDEDEKYRLLRDTLEKTIFEKPEAHCFDQLPEITEQRTMNAIGG